MLWFRKGEGGQGGVSSRRLVKSLIQKKNHVVVLPIQRIAFRGGPAKNPNLVFFSFQDYEVADSRQLRSRRIICFSRWWDISVDLQVKQPKGCNSENCPKVRDRGRFRLAIAVLPIRRSHLPKFDLV